MGIIIAFIIFSGIVLFHELGHFWLAKKNKIVVTEFSLGMGPRLWSRQLGETRYSLKLFPFGGSCAMLGEDEEESSEGSFNSKGVWQRFSVIAAGPFFNFIMAFVGAFVIVAVSGYDKPIVNSLEENSPAEEAGLKKGDEIVEFQGKKISLARDLVLIEQIDGLSEGKTTLTYKREGKKETISYIPNSVERYMLGFSYGQTEQEALITGVSLNMPMQKAGLAMGDVILKVNDKEIVSGAELAKYFQENPLKDKEVTIEYEHKGRVKTAVVLPEKTTYTTLGFQYGAKRERVGGLGLLKYTYKEVGYWVKTVYKSLFMLVKGQVSIKNLSGPVGVVTVIDDTYKEAKQAGAAVTWLSMLNMLVLLSANLGVMNLLPFPALDGGRLVFLLIEGILKKPVNRKVEAAVHFTGIVLLMTLMVFVVFNDIMKLF